MCARIAATLAHPFDVLRLQIGSNRLQTLPSELGLLTNLQLLYVRRSTSRHLYLRSQHASKGRQQPAAGASCRALPFDETQGVARATSRQVSDRGADPAACCLGLQKPARVAACSARQFDEPRNALRATRDARDRFLTLWHVP